MAVTATSYAQQTGYTVEERERLILDHLPQVRWVAYRLHEALQESVPVEDLISSGIIGLIQAVDNYDPNYNTKLKTYAEYKIRGAMLDSLRGRDGVPEHRRQRLKLIDEAIRKLEQRLLRTPEEGEIAAELGLGVSEYREWLHSVRGISLNSLDAGPDPEDGTVFANVIADPTNLAPDDIMERSELERIVAAAIDRMPGQERTILSLYYEQELSLREIASVLNMHHTRVCQIKTQAVLRLRSHLARTWPGGRGVPA